MPQDTTVFGPCAAMIHWMLELSSSWSGEKPTDADAFSGTWQWTTSLLYKKVIHAFYTSRAGIRQLTEGFPILSYVPLWNKRMKSPTGNKQAICPGWPGLMILGWVFGGSDQYQVGHTTNPTLVVNDILYIYCHHKPTVQPLTRNVKCTPLLSHPILLLGSQIFEETKLSSNHSHIRIHPILYPHHPHVITIFSGFPGMAYGSVLAVAPSVFRPRAVHNTPQARWKWPGAKLEPEIHGSCWDAAPGIIWDHFPTGGVEYCWK
jgi:hypothetical protein